MKIAFVKQDVYQDLYVAGPREAPETLLFSSLMRVGPIGLFTLADADFLILREEDTPECRAWEKVLPGYKPEWLRQLKDRPHSATDLPEAGLYQTENTLNHADFAVDAHSVDWGRYDVVIGINFPVPREIVERHPAVLWCYMIGEANIFMDHVRHGYDVALNQETRGLVAREPGIVDFPYSFVGPHCLETLMARVLGRPSARRGVFIEVNAMRDLSESERESRLAPLAAVGQPIRRHRQRIRENLTELYDSKYFVKSGGRLIRGNSVIEAISCGALVLMNPADLYHAQVLPRDTWIYSFDDARRRILELERDPTEYTRLQSAQRALVQSFVVDAPMESLRNCLAVKRSRRPRPPRSSWRKFASNLRRILTRDL